MPGLIGYLSDRPVEPGLIDAMVQPMRHRADYQIRHVTDGPAAFATIDVASGGQHDWARSADGELLLVCFGAIYESWAPRGPGLAPRIYAGTGHGLAATLLARWQTGGWQAVADLNGEYVIAVWERRQRRLALVNDRLGLKRLTLWRDATTFACASELKSLAVLPQVSRAIDEQAMAELLTFGHLQDERTLLRDVALLPPASYAIWQDGHWSLTQYWRYEFATDPRLEDDPQHVADEYAQRVEAAVARRVHAQDRLGLLLSGGLDSRTLAGMARRLRPDALLLSWTTGHAHAHDVRFARRIARAIGSAHTTIDIPETFLQQWAADYAWVLDGAVAADGCHRAAILEADGNSNMLLNGYLGDMHSGGYPLDHVYPHAQEPEELAEVGFRVYATGCDDALLESLLQPRVYARVAGLAREAFVRTMQEAPVEHPADRVIWAELRQFERLGNPRVQVEYLSAQHQVLTPFTDTEFIDFALRLPMRQRLGRQAYRAMICREFPELARVPKSGEGLPLVHSRLQEALHWRWVLFRRNQLPKFTGGLFGGHLYGYFVHCPEWFRSANRRFLERTLINNPLLAEHFQPQALEAFVRGFLDGTIRRDVSIAIAALVSFALFRMQLQRLSPLQPSELMACPASA